MGPSSHLRPILPIRQTRSSAGTTHQECQFYSTSQALARCNKKVPMDPLMYRHKLSQRHPLTKALHQCPLGRQVAFEIHLRSNHSFTSQVRLKDSIGSHNLIAVLNQQMAHNFKGRRSCLMAISVPRSELDSQTVSSIVLVDSHIRSLRQHRFSWLLHRTMVLTKLLRTH